MKEYNLTIRGTYSDISDAELEELVAGVQTQFPTGGNHLMYESVLSHGSRLQFQQIRDSQKRIDPQGSIMRRLQH